MKLVSTALLAAGLAALGACGGAPENVAATNVGEDLYNVAPDDLGTDNLLANDALGNVTLANGAADANASTDNSTGNAQ